MDEPQKVFRDSVHGYIKVPDSWCKRFIDTPIFQRLRRIEQTSMRCLYPSARHDRFIHSLGVYHLGRRAIDHLFENAAEFLDLNEIEIERYRTTFLIACLLHDCAHAPFSHTFEHYYDNEAQKLKDELSGEMSEDETFSTDLAGCLSSPHEQASAIIMLRHFKADIQALGGDPLLAARMITGCKYHRCGNDKNKRFSNALIPLLNGKAIDVDKLDYIIRDTWASGVDSIRVDLDRLLSAITVAGRPDKQVLAFKRTALSVVQSVVDARNFLHRWIYSHHKVVYDQYLLKTAVEKVAGLLDDTKAVDQNLQILFSLNAFGEHVAVGNFRFHLLSDGDLFYVLNWFQNDIPEAKEWLSRQHSHKAVWKSRPEYENLFHEMSAEETEDILRQIGTGLLGEFKPKTDFIWQLCQAKEVDIARNDVFFVFDGKQPVSYTDFFDQNQPRPAERRFFYVYADAGKTVDCGKLVKFLKANK